MKHIVVIAPGLSREKENLVTNFIKSAGYEWWHWGSESWLVVAPDSADVADLKNRIRDLLSQGQVLVLRVEIPQGGGRWASFGPKTWGEWLRANWK